MKSLSDISLLNWSTFLAELIKAMLNGTWAAVFLHKFTSVGAWEQCPYCCTLLVCHQTLHIRWDNTIHHQIFHISGGKAGDRTRANPGLPCTVTARFSQRNKDLFPDGAWCNIEFGNLGGTGHKTWRLAKTFSIMLHSHSSWFIEHPKSSLNGVRPFINTAGLPLFIQFTGVPGMEKSWTHVGVWKDCPLPWGDQQACMLLCCSLLISCQKWLHPR